MNDPKLVIGQLAKRWLASYGETLGTEEIRRHLSRLLSDLQKREIEQVFANWSGEQLMVAIEATFDLDDGGGVVRTKELAQGLCPPSLEAMQKEINSKLDKIAAKENARMFHGEQLGDTEYLPLEEANWTTTSIADPSLVRLHDEICEPVKRRGRPPGAKNKGKK